MESRNWKNVAFCRSTIGDKLLVNGFLQQRFVESSALLCDLRKLTMMIVSQSKFVNFRCIILIYIILCYMIAIGVGNREREINCV